MIGMWGSVGSGKTMFLISLYYDIQGRKDGNEIWSMVGQTPAADRLLIEGYKDLIESGVSLKTDISRIIEPLSFELVRPRKEQDTPGAGTKTHSFLSKARKALDTLMTAGADRQTIRLDLFDPAGEFFSQPNRLVVDTPEAEMCRKMLRESHGLLCLIDPDRDDGGHYFPLVYQNFVHLSQLLNGGVTTRLPIPVAICVTKADVHPEAFDNPRVFLRKTMGLAAFGALSDFCEVKEYFAVSALGRGNAKAIEQGGIVRYRLREGCDPSPENVWRAVEWLVDRTEGAF